MSVWKTLTLYSQSFLPVFSSKQTTCSPSFTPVADALDDVDPAVHDERRGSAAERLLSR